MGEFLKHPDFGVMYFVELEHCIGKFSDSFVHSKPKTLNPLASFKFESKLNLLLEDAPVDCDPEALLLEDSL